MITKKFFLGMGLGLCSLLAVSATDSKAEVGFCSQATVSFAGAQGGQRLALLRSTRIDCAGWAQNTDMWFNLDAPDPLLGNAKLAAVLSAQASGKTVTVVPVDPTIFANFGGLTGVFVSGL